MGATTRQIERVYRSRYSGFVGAMTAVVRNPEDAADVVQDGFAQALTRRREFHGAGPLEAWIWKIALRKAFDRLAGARVQVPLRELPELGLPDPETDPELEAALRQCRPVSGWSSTSTTSPTCPIRRWLRSAGSAKGRWPRRSPRLALRSPSRSPRDGPNQPGPQGGCDDHSHQHRRATRYPVA